MCDGHKCSEAEIRKVFESMDDGSLRVLTHLFDDSMEWINGREGYLDFLTKKAMQDQGFDD